ncbi:MAG TPA: serine hydroxymethyltransferase, partial [Desulfobacterales bacterium]|nr:serine hydroxymethyltransferase [Desulfobacterales bacterium]
VTSGIRIGTPALTTRGMKAPEMRQVVDFIHRALSAPTDVSSLEHLQKEVKDFCHIYPLFSPEWYCEVQ